MTMSNTNRASMRTFVVGLVTSALAASACGDDDADGGGPGRDGPRADAAVADAAAPDAAGDDAAVSDAATPDAAPPDALVPADGAAGDATPVETEIVALEGTDSYCPAETAVGLPCAAEPETYWWCTNRVTCDIWACAPVAAGATWVLLETAPDSGCTDGCPDDFDAAFAEMEYCEGMVCLERTGDDCRELRCLSGFDVYVLNDVECPPG
jgi:hypothetical protein